MALSQSKRKDTFPRRGCGHSLSRVLPLQAACHLARLSTRRHLVPLASTSVSFAVRVRGRVQQGYCETPQSAASRHLHVSNAPPSPVCHLILTCEQAWYKVLSGALRSLYPQHH